MDDGRLRPAPARYLMDGPHAWFRSKRIGSAIDETRRAARNHAPVPGGRTRDPVRNGSQPLMQEQRPHHKPLRAGAR